MPIWKELMSKRFWTGVMLSLIVALVVSALGAWLAAVGVVKTESVWLCVCLAWGCAGLCAGAVAGRQGEGRLLRAVVMTAAAMAVLWCIGLTVPGEVGGEPLRWIWYIAAALTGAIVSVMPSKKGRRNKKRLAGKRR